MQAFRLPAVPLIAHDPYFSVWSFTDNLNESYSRHWTGGDQGMCALARIDGKGYVLMGDPPNIAKAKQMSCTVLPTRTIYVFEAKHVEITLIFMTPAILGNLDLLSRPVTYLEYSARSLDGKPHQVKVFYDAPGAMAVDSVSQKVNWSRYQHRMLELLTFQHDEGRILNRAGDNLRIDWGKFFVAVPKQFNPQTVFAPNAPARQCFADSGDIADEDNIDMPRAVRAGWISAVCSIDLGSVGSEAETAHLLLAYDDVNCIEYLGRKLVSYWRRDNMSFSELLTRAEAEFEVIKEQCVAYDEEWMTKLTRAGGEKYALICAGAFRQAISAHKLAADFDGTPLFFSKENFSNGCIATVDVTYPSAPLFLYANPELLKGMLIPILDYASSRGWKFPFAPHDLGTYPLANGQIYGGGEETEVDQMPVEECGNMLILAGALLHYHQDLAFVQKYYGKLTQWADYLADKGYDPDNQLCTDDFAGHLAHNTNLSLKAIAGLGAYAKMAAAVGDLERTQRFTELGRTFAQRWIKDAAADDHYRLAFDQVDSWSMKYNLIWDQLLELNFFPPEVAATELKFYRKQQNRYGLPLDNRATYTKLDWILWCACLTGSKDDFAALTNPVFTWLNETASRVPMTDWYDTVNGKQIGFQARSVVGGLFIKLLQK